MSSIGQTTPSDSIEDTSGAKDIEVKSVEGVKIPESKVPVRKPKAGTEPVKSGINNSRRLSVTHPKPHGILQYRSRKSCSQLDVKEATRQNKTLVGKDVALTAPLMDGEAFKAQLAGMKIFTAVLLSRWRNSRQASKTLAKENRELVQGFGKSKQQLSIVNQLLSTECSRSEQLAKELRAVKDELQKADYKESVLVDTLTILKNENTELVEELKKQNDCTNEFKEEYLKLQVEFAKASQLLELKASRLLDAEKEIEVLHRASEDLYANLNALAKDKVKLIAELEEALGQKETELTRSKLDIEKMKQDLNFIKTVMKTKILESEACERQLKEQLTCLENEANILRQYVANTIGERIKSAWKNVLSYRCTALNVFYWILFATNPNLPRPCGDPITFGDAIEKAKNFAGIKN